MASGKPAPCPLDMSQRSTNEARYSEAKKDSARFKSTRGVLCDACSPRLEKLRVSLKFLREENSRLISQLHSVVGSNSFAESAGVRTSDEAMKLARFGHSLSSSSEHITAAAMHSLLPEAFLNPEDFHLAVVSSILKEQIARTEKNWKILAASYNELVQQIQQSEKTLADVRNRNFLLESLNAKLFNLMLYKQSSSQVFLNQVIDNQAASTKYVAQEPADCMNEKSPETGRASMDTFPIGTFKQKMGVEWRGNSSGPFYSSPVSVLGEDFDNEYLEDSIGVASKSPAYTSKGRTCGIENAEDTSMFCHAGDDDGYPRSYLLHPLVATPLAQEIHPPTEAAPMKCISAMHSRGNSAGIGSKRQLTSIFDASLCLSGKEGCNQLSPGTSSTQSSTSKL